MSAYKLIECNVSSQQAIIAGLLDMGLSLSEIEICPTPKNLEGYHGDRRNQVADIVVPRRNINRKLSGGMSNDLGFEKTEGGYKIHVSDYDQNWWSKKEKRFRRVAVAHQTEEQARRQGYQVVKTDNGNTIQLKLIKY